MIAPEPDWIRTTLRRQAEQAGSLPDDTVEKQEIKGVIFGAIYEFMQAEAHGYMDDLPQKDTPEQLASVAQHLTRNVGEPHPLFLAGMHYNSALVRMAAAYHRVLAVLTDRKGDRYELELYALKSGRVSKSKLNALSEVYVDVNKFKHRGGRLFKRSPVRVALEALGNLIGLAHKCYSGASNGKGPAVKGHA